MTGRRPPPIPGSKTPPTYRLLGLTSNPFRVLEPEELAEVSLLGEAELSGLLGKAERLIQVMGGRGRGKSTTLFAMQRVIRVEHEYRYLPPERNCRFLQPGSKTRILLLDEAQRLDSGGIQAARGWLEGGRDRKLVAATHVDLQPSFGVAAHTYLVSDAGADKIRKMVQTRIEWAGGTGITLSDEASIWLTARSAGSLRWVEQFCYELFQIGSIEPGSIDVDSLERVARDVPEAKARGAPP